MRLFNLHVFDEHLKDELLLPLTTVMVAQTPTPTPETRQMEPRDARDNTGLWGLLGLVGLAGLARRRRHAESAHSYTDTHARSAV